MGIGVAIQQKAVDRLTWSMAVMQDVHSLKWKIFRAIQAKGWVMKKAEKRVVALVVETVVVGEADAFKIA
jgi:hypothetical protein